MRIQAINSISSMVNCQPIKPVHFGKKQEKPENIAILVMDKDVFAPQNESVLSQKYDMACLVAGYYKDQYEQLLKQGGCNA